MATKNLQEGLGDAGVILHQSAVQHCLHKHDQHLKVIRRKQYLQPPRKGDHLKYAKRHLGKLDTF